MTKNNQKESPVKPSRALEDIRHFEKELIQNNMGTLSDLDDTDYYELMEVFNAQEPLKSLGSLFK